MSWALDHVFLATPELALLERPLADFGFTFTERRVHQGQGTANACAIFENAYLEILYQDNLADLGAPTVQALGLHERMNWRTSGACPVGLCFQPSGADADPKHWPFATWGYHAAYLASGRSIPMVSPASCPHEPLVFIKPAVGTLGQEGSRWREPSQHFGAPRKITGVQVQHSSMERPVSGSVQWFLENGSFALGKSDAPGLRLEFDHHRAGKTHHFGDAAPLTVCW